MRRRLDERRRHEQDGILRRQQEAEATARAVRREVANSSGSSVTMPVATPQPSRPPSQNRQYNDTYVVGPPQIAIIILTSCVEMTVMHLGIRDTETARQDNLRLGTSSNLMLVYLPNLSS